MVHGVASLLPLDMAGLRVVNRGCLCFGHSGTRGTFATGIWQLVSSLGPVLSSANFNLALFNFSNLYF